MPLQFTVRVKNEPGALARLASTLADANIDIRTIAGGSIGNFGCVVLSTSDDDAAREAMRRARYSFVEGEVLTFSVEDQPGSLARFTARLAQAGVNVQGLVILGRRQGKAEFAMTVDELDRARRVLST